MNDEKRGNQKREVLHPVRCPGCGEVLTWTAVPGAEAWCRRCRLWVRASLEAKE